VSWSMHRWAWRVASPLFVGATPSGILNRCRVYLPARPLWGALTAELARREADCDPAYRKVGDDLREHVRLSYLYPAERVGAAWPGWLPRYGAGYGLCWVREGSEDSVADRRFRRRLLWTRPGTAIDPDSDSALDGSLRETECVQTRWRHDDGSSGGPVALVGYVWVRQNAGLLDRVSTVTTLFVGGDTRYGLGRLDRVSMEPATGVFGATVELDRDEPRIVTGRLLAHAHPGGEVTICGDQEAVGGWDMTGQQQDRRISGPVWTPGSRCDQEPPLAWDLLSTGLLRLSAEPGG